MPTASLHAAGAAAGLSLSPLLGMVLPLESDALVIRECTAAEVQRSKKGRARRQRSTEGAPTVYTLSVYWRFKSDAGSKFKRTQFSLPFAPPAGMTTQAAFVSAARTIVRTKLSAVTKFVSVR